MIAGLLVYRYDSPLFFANAEDFRSRALAAVDDASGPVRWFLLNVEANVEVDITGADALELLRAELERRGASSSPWPGSSRTCATQLAADRAAGPDR